MTEQQDESVRIKSPYLIPLDEPVMLSFSGGRSSGYLLSNTLEVKSGQPATLKGELFRPQRLLSTWKRESCLLREQK